MKKIMLLALFFLSCNERIPPNIQNSYNIPVMVTKTQAVASGWYVYVEDSTGAEYKTFMYTIPDSIYIGANLHLQTFKRDKTNEQTTQIIYRGVFH